MNLVTSDRNTVVRTLHDLGGAAWFGGSLMGAVGLNGASKDVSDPGERATVATSGWARWSPVAASAIAAYAIGGIGLIVDTARLQQGLRVLQWATPALTGAIVVLGAQQGEQQKAGQVLTGAARRTLSDVVNAIR